MEVTGQYDALAAVPTWKNFSANRTKGVRFPELVWTFWRKEHLFVLSSSSSGSSNNNNTEIIRERGTISRSLKNT
jgi:hypothetical protein